MRIIGGTYRGRMIKQPVTKTTRPTKDRIREAVFNIIARKLPDANVLDIFAGSGAYGLEALSRGAQKTVFVEKDKRCVKIIKENIQLLDVEGHVEIIVKDAFKSISLLAERKEKFDLVFSDPPYNMGMAKKTLIEINQYAILKPAGLVVIEHARSEDVPEAGEDVSILKQKTYGDISISIFLKK